ncbi:MAG: methyltransferase [Alistipes sp.]
MFRFKQFAIEQDRCPMKVGTDGVLLGAWARVEATDRHLLDIGTGTGLIALMLAQRCVQAQVTGVDIDDVSQACANVSASPWADRVTMIQSPVQQFVAREPFDLIVSNPPYFVDSLRCPDAGRATARHAIELTFSDLHDAVIRLLAPDGRFCLILPPAEMELFLSGCRALYPVRRVEVHSTPTGDVRRVMLELQCAPIQPFATTHLTIGTGAHEQYTDEYRFLTRDFYLKF